MKVWNSVRITTPLIVLFLFSFFSNAQRCATPQRDSLMSVRYKNWAFQRRVLEDSVSSYLKNKHRNNRIGNLCLPIRIPVVVHIIHDNTSGTIGGVGNANISDTQIKNQIRILNEDYRRTSGTLGFNNNPVGADTGIEFYLANVDPNGKTTTGITRNLYTDKKSFDINADAMLLANIVSWPTDQYLNIWVIKSTNSVYLGVSQFPSVSGINGLDTSGELQDKTDGVTIDYRAFGTGGTVSSKLYHLGRTTTHEVGHWLGLLHTWGDTNCGDDYCADTPICEGGNQGFTCNPIYSNCNGTRTRNMIENYMDYSPDTCMNIFTVNQSERIQAVLEKSPRRAKLVRLSCSILPYGTNLQVETYPNPTNQDLNIKVIMPQLGNINMSLYSVSGQLIQQHYLENYPSWIFTLPVSSLANGEYILRVETQGVGITKRVIVAR